MLTKKKTKKDFGGDRGGETKTATFVCID